MELDLRSAMEAHVGIKTLRSSPIPGYEYCLLTEIDPEVQKTRSGVTCNHTPLPCI